MPLRLIFMGTPDFALPTLLELVAHGHEIAAVSGSEIARQLGLGDGVSRSEASVIDVIATKLRRHESPKG